MPFHFPSLWFWRCHPVFPSGFSLSVLTSRVHPRAFFVLVPRDGLAGCSLDGRVVRITPSPLFFQNFSHPWFPCSCLPCLQAPDFRGRLALVFPRTSLYPPRSVALLVSAFSGIPLVLTTLVLGASSRGFGASGSISPQDIFLENKWRTLSNSLSRLPIFVDFATMKGLNHN